MALTFPLYFHAAPVRCLRFVELDWYDGIEVGAFRLDAEDDREHWFLAQRLGWAMGVKAEGEGTNLYVCTRLEGDFDALVGGDRASDTAFLEYGTAEGAEEAMLAGVRDNDSFIALFSNDHRTLLRSFRSYGALRSGSDALRWLWQRSPAAK